MDEATRHGVRQRAADRCEYCGLHQDAEPFFRFHIEHIIARQHSGSDDLANLALACHHCNAHKGPNLSAVDSESGQITMLFHPRQQNWLDHFVLVGNTVRGLTATGRATVQLLKMNAAARQELRI